MVLALLVVACVEGAAPPKSDFQQRGCRERSCFMDRAGRGARTLPTVAADGAILGAPVALANQCTGAAVDSTIGTVSVTRAGNAYCPMSDGTFVLVSADKPRVSRMGLLVEGAQNQLLSDVRDLTQVSWVKVNVTAAKTATGADGAANAATTLTATAANGTALQTVVVGGAPITAFSASVRRRTGAGNIFVTFDNFATSCDVTLGLSNAMANGCQWIRVAQDIDTFRDQATEACTLATLAAVSQCAVLAQSSALPIVGFKIATSGDAIDVDFTQLEQNEFSSSPMSGTTRAADDVRFVTTTWPTTQGSFELRWSPHFMPSDMLGSVHYAVDTRETNTAGGDGIFMFLDGTNAKLGTITGGANLTQDSHFTTNDFLTPYGKPRLWRMEWDSTSLRLKVNGILRGTTATPFVPTLHTGNRVGSRYDTAKFSYGILSNIGVSPTAVSSTDKGVALIGDSILEGKYQERVGDVMFESLAGRGGARRFVTSFAQSGSRLTAGSTPCTGNYTTHIQGNGFDTVIVHCGVNDLLTGGEDAATAWGQMKSLIDTMISDGVPHIVISELLPCKGYFTCLPDPRAAIITFNASLNAYAVGKPSMTVFHGYALFGDPNDTEQLVSTCTTNPTGDGLHLNDTCNLTFGAQLGALVP
jgi:hypothetical protein